MKFYKSVVAKIGTDDLRTVKAAFKQPQAKLPVNAKIPAVLQKRLKLKQPNQTGLYATVSGNIRWRLLPINWNLDDAQIQIWLWKNYKLAVSLKSVYFNRLKYQAR